jgi:hypothetical protein
MPRLKADITITVRHHRTGERFSLELIAQPWPGRVWLRRDRRNSRVLPESTPTHVCDQLRRWITKRLNKAL